MASDLSRCCWTPSSPRNGEPEKINNFKECFDRDRVPASPRWLFFLLWAETIDIVGRNAETSFTPINIFGVFLLFQGRPGTVHTGLVGTGKTFSH